MGCFSDCFSKCNSSSRRHRRCSNGSSNGSRRRVLKPSPPSLLDHLQNYQSVEELKLPQLIKEEDEEDGAKSKEQEQEQERGEENAEKNSIDILHDLIDEKEEEEENANRSGRKKVRFDLNVKFYENLVTEDDEEEEEEEKQMMTVCECGSDSSSSSLFSYPLNHRYQNSRDSDDDEEFEDVLSSDDDDCYEDADDDDDDYSDSDEDGDVVAEEQSSESLFSLSIESRKQKLSAVVEGDDKEVNSPIPANAIDRSKYVESVLNPVENLSQWKDIKARSRVMSKHERKENQQGFGFPVENETVQGKKEVAVDTSLSTWLVGSEQGAFQRSNSSVSVGNNSQSDRKKPVSVRISQSDSRNSSVSVGNNAESDRKKPVSVRISQSDSRNSSVSVGNNAESDRKKPVSVRISQSDSRNSSVSVGNNAESDRKKPVSVRISGNNAESDRKDQSSEQEATQRRDSRNSSVSVRNSQSNTSRNSSVTANKFEDRPILGALTLEEIRQMSAANSTPRKSPGRSPDDMPIIGSVGSYWSRTTDSGGGGGSSAKSTKSRYRESAEVLWDPTPFETRLEKALEKEANSGEVIAV